MNRQPVAARLAYYRRVFSAYVARRQSHLTFWHDTPVVNDRARVGELGEYYMTFTAKADYPGPRDGAGIPLLDYQGKVGRQYNPIAIAQYGLANFNLLCQTGAPARRERVLAVGDWLVANLERNPGGQWVWNHHFDWEYRTPLTAPWYSALAQGQGMSLLLRADWLQPDRGYRAAAEQAFVAFRTPVGEGGVTWWDEAGDPWFEETIVDPPTHILNGFLWASWGVHDYHLATGDPAARDLFTAATRTLTRNLHRFDTGYWSLYEQAGTRLPMLASPFYHRLHIVQLRVMFRLTGDPLFAEYAGRWARYERDPIQRRHAIAQKALFKLLYY